MKPYALLLLGLALLALLVVHTQAQMPAVVHRAHPLLRGQLGWWRGVPGLTMSSRLYNLLGRTHCTLTNMGTRGSTSGWSPTTRRGGFMHLNLDGTNDYVDCGADALVADVPLRTVALWIFLTGYGSTNNIRVVDKRNMGGWTLGVNNSQVSAGLNLIQDFDTSPGNWALSNKVPLNTWVHIGVTYDRGDASTVPVFYVNGEAFAPDTTINPPSGTASSDAASTLALGAEDLGTGKALPGALNDVRFWARLLSAAEMREVYRQSLVGDPALFQTPREVVAAPVAGLTTRPGAFFPFFR
jgi:Concanavalin A-like lectin/glucanases superfamily